MRLACDTFLIVTQEAFYCYPTRYCLLHSPQHSWGIRFFIKDILTEIYRADLQSCVYDAFYQVMMPQYGADSTECYKARFYSYGLFGLLDEWIKRGFYETPEEMARLINEII